MRLPPKAMKRQTKMKLSTATDILKNAGIVDAKREARLLFMHFSGLSNASLYGGDAESDSQELISAVERRKNREPLQYIIGEVDFYKETYKVTPDCLIPRSDTEILVDEVIKRLSKGARFIDLCTGSGCIALSTLNNTNSTSAVAVDISENALAIARENADRLSLTRRIDFLNMDALSEAVKGSFFAVISNPPYVTDKAYKSLEPEIYFEPSIAFLGGEDGMKFYGKIISLYKDSLADGGFFAFEIGYDQGDLISALANAHSLKIEIYKDYSGNDRVAILRK